MMYNKLLFLLQLFWFFFSFLTRSHTKRAISNLDTIMLNSVLSGKEGKFNVGKIVC